ncbi:lysylphosphatidylglycerol synthase transmembrane domain-containing protein [Rubrobacter calidifluminis]|uniref:lysylphosphatidylglycerol synthase transmembrane domain-containing protein n=1 Tax=Rubrobacter calidifluminis TaxID=1392640 RepID=UPI0023628C1F|nr:lysylphosphatidylglycerol synthase transmembrane domain-containing protein [Rubrobacter calidifluminis]
MASLNDTAEEEHLRSLLRNILYLVSVGLALHLLLPQLPGITRSVRLVLHADTPAMVAAFLSEILRNVCYSELLGRSVGTAAGIGASPGSRRQSGIGFWYMLRLTLSGLGASKVLPGGGAAAATVTYGGLRKKNVPPRRAGLALAAATALSYATLGVLFAASAAYMLAHGEHGAASLGTAFAGLFVAAVLLCGGYAAYRNPGVSEKALARAIELSRRIPGLGGGREPARLRAARIVDRTREELRAMFRQVGEDPAEAWRLVALACGYWAFDALCLILMFRAFEVRAGTVGLLVSYGLATTAASLPITPGGIGVFETLMLGTLALLGTGSEAVVPVLGYRILNFWLPIPLAAVLYPTLNLGQRKSRRRRHRA